MAEYIERNALIAKFKRLTLGENSLVERLFADGVYAVIETFPAADVVEVKHGRWIFDRMIGEWSYYSHCSECNHQEFFANGDAEKRHKYCLNCGTRMDGEDEHEVS